MKSINFALKKDHSNALKEQDAGRVPHSMAGLLATLYCVRCGV